MILRPTALAGLVLIEPAPHADERGRFTRLFCGETFAKAGLPVAFAQASTSFNLRRGTLRGLHYQTPPYAEGKLVRCTRGRIFDVAVDLRPGSPTYGGWLAVELAAESARQLYIPEGFAHGFQTLTDEAEIHYQITVPYRPEASRGIRWDDPALAIPWPVARPILSARDRSLPRLEALAA